MCVCVFIGFPTKFLSCTYSSLPYVLLASSVSLFWCGQHNVIWWRVEEVYLNSLIMDFSPLSSYLSILLGPLTSPTTCPQTPSLYALRFQEERPLFTFTYNKRCNYGFPTVHASISFLLLPYIRVRPCLWNDDLCRTHWPSPGWRVNEHGISVEWYLPLNSRSTKQRTCPNATLSTSDDTCTVLCKNPGLCPENFLYGRAVDTPVISNEKLTLRFRLTQPTV